MRLLLIPSLILAALQPVLAESTGPTVESLSTRMMNFYTSPSRADFDIIQREIQANLPQFESRKNGFDTLSAVFIARVHEKYRWSLMDLGPLDDRAKSIVARDSTTLSTYVNDDSQLDPGKLDIWWISFFATGDTRYLDRIAGQVGDVKAQSGTAKILLTGAANWSFLSNCRQHPAVRQYAKSLLARDPPVHNRRDILDIVAKSEAPDSPQQDSAQWKEAGKDVPDEPWRRSAKGFGAMLLITDNPDAFFKEWNTPPSVDFKPHISTTTEAHRGRTVVAVVLFSTCKPNSKGTCASEVDFKVLRPDGSTYAEHKGAELWKGKPAPPEGILQLAVANLGFRVELDDPLGEYRIQAVVRDTIAGVEVPLVQILKVLPTE